jgi:hypothetical protein
MAASYLRRELGMPWNHVPGRAKLELHGSLWHVEIVRFDRGAFMAVWEVNLDVTLAELVRYASADAAKGP